MGSNGLLGGLTGLLAVFAMPTIASANQPTPVYPVTASSFSLMGPSVAPPRDISLRPAAADPRKPVAIMPRDVPAVSVDDATPFPVPGYDWQTPNGGLVRLRPAKLRFKMGF